MRGIKKQKATKEDKEIKVFYNEEIPDQPLPEITNLEELKYQGGKLKDLNLEEGRKLTNIESGAMNLTYHTSDELREGATNKYLLDGAVTELKLANRAVTNAKIAIGAIQGDVIAAGAITETKISDLSISTPKLQAGAVTTAKLAAGAVTANEIAAGAITTEKLAAGAVTSDKVTTGTLITLSAQIADAIITNAKIANLAVNNAKIAADLSADKITTGTLNASIVNVINLNASNITTGTLSGIIVQSSSGSDRIVLNTGNYLDFYAGGVLKARIRATTAGAGGLKLVNGDIVVSNPRSLLMEEATSNYFARIGCNTVSQLVMTLPSTNQFFVRNYEETENLFTVSSMRVYAGKPLGLPFLSSPPGAASSWAGYMYWDTTQSDIVFSNGSNWHKVDATPI